MDAFDGPPDDKELKLPVVTVLDGGFSTQIQRHVGERVDGDPLWTARFLKTNPKAVMDTHLDFLRAGADGILTNTYQASIEGFKEHLRLPHEDAYKLMKKAVYIAKEARAIHIMENKNLRNRPVVIGSVGPYGAHLHNGSEYTGNYARSLTIDDLVEWHRPRFMALIEAGLKLIAFETVPCEKEAVALCELLGEFPHIKAYLSFNCRDDKCIANGENFEEVAIRCWEQNKDQLLAVGVNCVSPHYVTNLIKNINKKRDPIIPLVVYPNSGELYDQAQGHWSDAGQCESLAGFIEGWLDLGVRFIGGCCRTNHDDVEDFRRKTDMWSLMHDCL